MQLPPRRHRLSLAVSLVVTLASSLAVAPAWAHFGGAIGGGWREGFAHPLSGLDHVVAMVAVGLWPTRMPRSALWLLAPIVPLFMALGVSMVPMGWVLPGAEDGTAISVAVLGVLLAVAARPPLAVGAAMAALFGLVHGYAHGAAMPETATPLVYGAGLITATIMLQLAGIGAGLLARSAVGQRALPIGAAAIAGIGITLVLALYAAGTPSRQHPASFDPFLALRVYRRTRTSQKRSMFATVMQIVLICTNARRLLGRGGRSSEGRKCDDHCLA